MDRMIASLGFASYTDFVKKFVLPIFGISAIMFFSIIFLFPEFPFYVPYILLFLGVSFIFLYPYIIFDGKKTNIQNTIHLFITYAGTISTLSLGRSQIFGKLADKDIYKEISESMKKIVYLAREWKLGFSKATRRVGSVVPSQIYADFLDRLASALDFGEELEVFFAQEQDSVMTDFETTYQASLQTIEMIKDVFVAITISIAFALASSLLLPLLMGISVFSVIKWCLYAVIVLDLLIVVIVKSMIPDDPIMHNLPSKYLSKEQIILKQAFIASLAISIILAAAFLSAFGDLPKLVSLSLACIPMFFVGVYGLYVESQVGSMDRVFPTFIRAVGNSLHARGGTMVGTLQGIRVHKFGYIDNMIEHLYRRLKVGSDKIESWIYFIGESGSNLIKQFTHIFIESIYFGGDPQKISDIISKNFQRVMSLRKLKTQVAQGMRGALYGGLLGFTASVFVSVEISGILFGIFSDAFTQTGSSGDVGKITSAIIPGGFQTINMDLVMLYITIMVVFHSLVSSFVIKLVDGGTKYGVFFDFTIMIFLGGIMSWGIPIVFKMLIGPAFGSLG